LTVVDQYAGLAARQIILKVHSRCNLSCGYCYVYHSVDTGWRRRPATLQPRTLGLVAARIGEHVRRHAIGRLAVVLHGGEPLLAGHDGVEAALRSVRAAVPPGTEVDFSLQTNGILLDEAFLRLFRSYGVRVGVSLDGGRRANDRHRRYAGGAGSYARAAAGVRLLGHPAHRDLFAGLLCTIDVRNDPVEVYEDLLGLAPPALDLLLPHGNWTNPPPRPAGAVSYAGWLIAVFDRWYGRPRAETRIRLFESILSRLLGGPSGTEAIGGERPGIVVIETDGSYEQSDALKTTTDGGAATGLHVAAHSLDDVLRHLDGAGGGAPSACRGCPVVSVCGGGLRAHRYRAGRGDPFDNPSAYCADLLEIIGHIRRRVTADLLERRAVPKEA
jgi:uncharacterized protein